ncbi:MAG: hypothetical protein M3Q30_02875 [Actinomycetota bacterium]|nr:hypothetical protein [Actinomycetota bacterium]
MHTVDDKLWHRRWSLAALVKRSRCAVDGFSSAIRQSRHRLILSGLGLGGLAVILGGASIARRTRTNLRHARAVVAGT